MKSFLIQHFKHPEEILGIFELVVSYFGTPGLRYEIRTLTLFKISSRGALRRRFAKLIANISQRHDEHVSLGML